MLKDPDHRPLIIGIGNVYRGDDALGPELVDFMQDRHHTLGEYIRESSDLSRLLEHWHGRDTILVDAVAVSQPTVGRIHQLNSRLRLFDENITLSTHGISLVETLRLGGILSRMPKSFLFIGAEGKCWDTGEPLSPQLKDIIPDLAGRIEKYIMIHLKSANQNLSKVSPETYAGHSAKEIFQVI